MEINKTIMWNTKKVMSKEQSNVIIAEIHEAFDSAQERLLGQAKNILDTIVVDQETALEEKSSRLKALGFNNTNEVFQANELTEEREKKQGMIGTAKDFAEMINYYKAKYPFQKFLTEAEMIRICKKYSLIYAPVSHFIGDVPEKNLNEIENAQEIEMEDVAKNKTLIEVTKFWSNSPSELKEFLKDGFEYKGRIIHGRAPSDGDLAEAIRDAGYKGAFGEYIYSLATVKEVQKSGLFICAPVTDFNLEGLTKDKELGYTAVREYEIKDPIVFRYVKGGIQVISKWGLEASDEALVNEIDN